MMLRVNLVLAVFGVAILAGCETTTEPGQNAGTEQLRASLTPAMRTAGVSDECIAQLPSSTLAEIKGLTNSTTYASVQWLQQRQRIRTAAGKICDPV